jgi:soluble lytic murein transglycosylase-like protein
MKAKHKTACMSLILLVLVCIPAQAQMISLADERGNPVYVYEGPAASSMTMPAKADPAVTAPAATPAASAPASTARPTTPEELDRLVQKTAEKHRVDPRLVRAVIATESNWNATALSRKGAQGLMQLIPTTAQQLGVADAFDPAQNVDGGVRYLSMMLNRYYGDVPKALAAYNAGPGAVDRSGGVPRIQETRNYVQKVTSAYWGGTGLQPRAIATATAIPIYRAVEADGRVVFRNE